MASQSPYDTLESVRFQNHNHSRSSIESSFEPDLNDLDINALDREFQTLTLAFQNNLRDLQADPNNLSKKRSILQIKEKMDQIKLWSSKLNTEEGRRLLDEHRNDIEQRKYEIDQVLKMVKAQSAVDICFLMDCTGSMSPYINEAKNNINNLANTITAVFNTSPHLGFVGYRDINCQDDSLIKFDFKTDINAFRKFLSNVTATGGADTCEDVFGGLEAVITLGWSNPNRILIHLCDAPCHGRDYYENRNESDVSFNTWDRYPDGDPCKRDICQILLDIKRRNIQYFSIQLNKHTAKMFDKFQLIYGSICQLHVAKPIDLINIISRTATNTIMSTINNTMSIFKTTEQRKHYSLNHTEPDWSTMNIHPLVRIEITLPETIEELFHPLHIGIGHGRMQIATNPFAQGSLRYAYYGKMADDNLEMVDVVYKELISANPRYNTLTAYKQHLEIHTLAQCLANLFNKAQREVFRKPIEIFYIDAYVVQQTQDPTKIYQVERRFKQTIQKWNNNSGGVHFMDYSTTLQAFSHWTHHQTAGRMMVVDLQGVKSLDDHRYLLTDPAIHFDDIKRYRVARTNLSVKGMREFFRTHVCSEVCARLGLEKVTNNIDQNTAKEFYKTNDMHTIKEEPTEDAEAME